MYNTWKKFWMREIWFPNCLLKFPGLREYSTLTTTVWYLSYSHFPLMRGGYGIRCSILIATQLTGGTSPQLLNHSAMVIEGAVCTDEISGIIYRQKHIKPFTSYTHGCHNCINEFIRFLETLKQCHANRRSNFGVEVVLKLPIPGESGNRIIPLRESGIQFPGTRIILLKESRI